MVKNGQNSVSVVVGWPLSCFDYYLYSLVYSRTLVFGVVHFLASNKSKVLKEI